LPHEEIPRPFEFAGAAEYPTAKDQIDTILLRRPEKMSTYNTIIQQAKFSGFSLAHLRNAANNEHL